MFCIPTAAPPPESKKVTWTLMYITQLLCLTMMTKELIFLIILNQSQTATLAHPMASVQDGTICPAYPDGVFLKLVEINHHFLILFSAASGE